MNHTVLGPSIFLYENVIDNCNEIIDMSLAMNDWQDATVFDDTDAISVNSDLRKNRSLMIPLSYRNDPKWFCFAQNIFKTVDEYANDRKVYFNSMEPLQILHYLRSDGWYGRHFDAGPPNRRVISSVLYLNTLNEGGETYFHDFDISVKPKAGSMVVFPSNYAYAHSAKSPISEDKFVAVTWFAA